MTHNLRVALSGSYGVGKTTVFGMLEHTNKIGEIAREVIREMEYNPRV